jgi:hypothetical protein
VRRAARRHARHRKRSTTHHWARPMSRPPAALRARRAAASKQAAHESAVVSRTVRAPHGFLTPPPLGARCVRRVRAATRSQGSRVRLRRGDGIGCACV